MGITSSVPRERTHEDRFEGAYIVEEFGVKRCPCSLAFSLSEWDIIPDKNIQYYSGERFCRTPDTQK